MKRHLIIYPYVASLVITIWLAAAIETSHEQLPSMEKVSIEVADQNHSPGGILQNAILKKSETLPIKLQAIRQEHLFYGISPSGCFSQISSWKAIQKVFERFPRKYPWRSLRLYIDLKLYENTILTRMFSHKFWEFFRTTFPLKALYYLWMEFIYSLKMRLQNTFQTLPKICDSCSLYAGKYFVNRNSSQPWFF